MIIVLRCSILAVIIFIPFSSIQHFIEPLSYCLLADICNHTWIPECALDVDWADRRLFIDECDLFEYNCDYEANYLIVNYSDCFGPTCPTLPSNKMFLRQGDYIYRADGRLVYSPLKGKPPPTQPMQTSTTKKRTPKHFNGKRRYTPEKGRSKKTTKPCSPCMRWKENYTPTTTTTLKPKRKSKTTRKHHQKTKKEKAYSSQVQPPKLRGITGRFTAARTTKQVIRTATLGTLILGMETIIIRGKKAYKVIKGYASTTRALRRADSDFLE